MLRHLQMTCSWLMAPAYGTTFAHLPALIRAAAAPQWTLAAVAAACLALVYASVYVTQIEKRLPLIYYKRRAQVLLRTDHSPAALTWPLHDQGSEQGIRERDCLACHMTARQGNRNPAGRFRIPCCHQRRRAQQTTCPCG